MSYRNLTCNSLVAWRGTKGKRHRYHCFDCSACVIKSLHVLSTCVSSLQRQELKVSEKHQKAERSQKEPRLAISDETPVLNFVDKEAENACHHGLVDPTINMKEAMNAINNMFKEPIETAPLQRKPQQRSQDKENQGGFEVFVDENQGSFEIFVDDENDDETTDDNDESGKGFVFLQPRDHSPESSGEADRNNSPPRARFREDTVVRRFVGSAISEEPAVENVCHHGLVDPTVNLKEAMEDINNMFGEPIDFVRPNRSKNKEKAVVQEKKPDAAAGFSILEDDDDEAEEEHQETNRVTQMSPRKANERDLFEPTVCTKVALDEINKLFAMPMDF